MRTVVPCRKGSAFSSRKSHFSTGNLDTTMALSDLLHIQRCKLNTFGRIEEEQSSDMDVENDNVRLYDGNSNNDNNKFVKDITNISNNSDKLSVRISSNDNETQTPDIYNLNNSVVKNRNFDDIYSSTGQQSCLVRTESQMSTRTSTDETWAFSKEKRAEIKATRCQSEVKSGHLMFITSDQNLSTVLPTSKSPTFDGSKPVFPTRFPVLVKIHRKSCERYAIISLTRHRQTLPSVFLRLKRSRVTQSTSSPCRFIVVVDGPEGKSLTFEASSPESALEWMRAFSSDRSHYPALTVERQVSCSSDVSTVSTSSSTDEGFDEKPRGPSQNTISELNAPTPSLKLPSSPFLPVLSESFDEEEEEEENE